MSNVHYGTHSASSDFKSVSRFSDYFSSIYKPVNLSCLPEHPFEHPYSLSSNCILHLMTCFLLSIS
ncbi:Reverse transcriptase domain-containing protein [Aphis craccivora]|uniref:Reverse transcriptase domain-containing protein n=1 Tax=Aphis craccivora TaxID=307492 RepID=A0A6G0YEU8_APHCR|nr:Reverse transcriptase domain-containing protein [Aphis craccivora]